MSRVQVRPYALVMTNTPETRLPGLSERLPFLVPGIVAASFAMSGLALLPLAYFDFLRGVLCTFALILAAVSVASKRAWWIVGSVVILALWSPSGAIWFHPGRSVWVALDVLAAAFFTVAALLVPAMSVILQNGKPSRFQTWWFYSLTCIAVVLFFALALSPSGIPEH